MFLHVRLKVRDMDRAIAFYTTHLGFELRDRKTSPRGSQLVFLKHPSSPTELELAFLPWDPDFQLNEDIFHLAFEVADMHATLASMRAGATWPSSRTPTAPRSSSCRSDDHQPARHAPHAALRRRAAQPPRQERDERAAR